MATKPGRTYGGLSPAQRREQRRQKFLDAGLEQFGTKGAAGVRLQDVLAEAGISERYFYESFRNLEELGSALVAHHLKELTDEIQQLQLPPERPETHIRTILTVFVEHMTKDPRVGRILIHEAIGQGGALGGQREHILNVAEGVAERWVQLMFAKDKRPHDPADARLTAAAMIGACAQVWSAWIDGRFAVSSERIIDHMAKLFEASVQIQSSTSATERPPRQKKTQL